MSDSLPSQSHTNLIGSATGILSPTSRYPRCEHDNDLLLCPRCKHTARCEHCHRRLSHATASANRRYHLGCWAKSIEYWATASESRPFVGDPFAGLV